MQGTHYELATIVVTAVPLVAIELVTAAVIAAGTAQVFDKGAALAMML